MCLFSDHRLGCRRPHRQAVKEFYFTWVGNCDKQAGRRALRQQPAASDSSTSLRVRVALKAGIRVIQRENVGPGRSQRRRRISSPDELPHDCAFALARGSIPCSAGMKTPLARSRNDCSDRRVPPIHLGKRARIQRTACRAQKLDHSGEHREEAWPKSGSLSRSRKIATTAGAPCARWTT